MGTKKASNTIKKNALLFYKTCCLVIDSSKFYVIIILIINVMIGILPPIQIILNRYFINSITEFKNMKMVIYGLSLIGICTILLSILMNINDYTKKMLSDYLNKNISGKILSEVDFMSMDEFDDPEVYNELSKISSEALVRSMRVLDNACSILTSAISYLGTFVILYQYYPIIPFIIIAIMFPLLVLDVNISSRLYDIYKSRIENLRLIENLKQILVQYNNIKEIRAYNLGKHITHKILSIYDLHIKENKKIRAKNTKYSLFFELSEVLVVIGIKIYLVSKSIILGSGVGTIIAQISAVDSQTGQLKNIIQIFSSVFDDNLYMDSLFSLIERTKVNSNKKLGNKKKIVKINSIEFRNVFFRYPSNEEYILKGLNFTVSMNKMYLLLGVNGSGKSTIIKLLLRLYQPTSGEILVNGMNINNIDEDSYRKLISVVFQDFIRYPLSVEENISFGDIENYNDSKRMQDVAKIFGIDLLVRKFPNQYKTVLQSGWTNGTDLSGGQWQKIAICRALFRKSQALILDEPTAALDPQSEFVFYRNIMKTSNGKMCIIISHKMIIAEWVDRIMLLADGKILEEGTFDQLNNNDGVFRKLYNFQFENECVTREGVIKRIK